MDNKIPTISNTRKSPASRSGSKVVRSQVKTIFGEQSEQTAGNPPDGASSSSEKNVGAEVMTKAQQDAQKGPPNYQAPLQTPPPSGVSGSWTPSLAQADIQKNRNPTPSMMNDYYASSPRLFPHICSLCSIECGHLKDWITHQNTPGHIESCRKIRIQYPQWNPHVLAPIRHDDNKSDGGSSKRSRSISPRRSRGSGPRGRPRRSRSKSPRKSGRTRSRSRSPRRPRRIPNRSRSPRRRPRSPRRSLLPKRPRRAWASRMNSYSPDKRAVDAAVASFIESTKVKSGDKIPTRASSNGRKESPKSSTTRAKDKQSDSSTTLSKKTVSGSSSPRKTGSVSSASSSKKSSSISAKKPTSDSSSRITPSSSTSSNKPSSSSSTAKKPASSSSTAKKPASSSSTAKKPASSSSTAKKPASSSSTAKKPASSSSTAKKPASSSSTAKKPASSSSTAKKPPSSSSTVKKPAFSSSTAKKPTPGFFSNKNDTNSARKVTPDGKKPFQAKKTPAHAHPKASSADVFNPLHKFKTKTTGTIIHVTNLPDSDYTDQDIMKIVQPFGKVSDILIIRSKNEAYLQTNFKEAASAAVEFSESVPVMVNKTRVKLSLAGHKKEPAAAVPVVKKQENPKKEEENKPCEVEEEEAAEAAVAEMVVQEKCEKETKPRPKTKLPEVIPPGFMKVYKLAEPKFQDTEKCVIVVSNLPEGQPGVEEISNLAKPFGGVVDIIFVSTHRKVYLQLSSKSSADSMIKFYSAFPTFISGNSLSIAVNPKFKDLKDEDRIFAEIVEQSPYKIKPTIYERFVHLNNLPEKGYTEFEVACVGLRFGKVEHYVIFANKRKAILHMSCVSAARAMRNFLSQYPCFIADCVATCALSSKMEMAEDEYVSMLEPVKKSSEAEGAPDDTETAQTADDEAAKGGVKAETSADNVPASSDDLNTPASPTPPEAAPPAVPTPETTEPETTPEAEDESQAVDPAPVDGADEEHMAVESPVEQSTETEESMQTDSELTEPTEQATHEQPDDSEMEEQEASDTALEIEDAIAVSEDEDFVNDDGDEDDGDDDGDEDEEAAEAPDTPVGAMPEWGYTEIVAPAEESEPVVEYNVPEGEDLEVLVTVESDEEEEEPHLGFLGSTLCKSFQLQAKTAEASAMDNISSTACDEAEDLVGVTVDPEAEDCEMLESSEPSEAINVDMEESEEPKSPEQLSPVQTDVESREASATPEPSPNLKDTQKKVLKDQSLTNTELVTPTVKGDAGNVTPTVKGDAGNVTPTGKGDAGNVTPTGKGDAGNVTPTGKGDAGNVTPTGKGDAGNDKEAKLEDAPASVSAKKARDSRPSESSTKDSGDSKPLSPLSRTAKYNPHRGELSVTVTLDSQRWKSDTRKWPSAERRSSGRESSTPKSSSSRSSPTETSQSNPKYNQSSQKKTAGKSVPSQQDRESKGASKPWEREARSNPRKDDRSKNPPPKYVRSSKGSSRGSKSNEDQGSDQFPFNLEEFVTVDEIVEEQADIRCVKITPAAGKKEKRKEPERSPSEVRKVKGKSMGAHSARKESFVTLDEVGDDDSPPGPDSDLMHESQSLATVDEVHNDEDQPAFEKVSQDLMTLDEVSDEEDISQVNDPDFAKMPDDLSKEPLLVTLDEVHEEEDEMPSKPKPFDPAKPGAEGGGDRKAAKGNNKAFSNISEDPSDDITEQPLLTLDEVKGDDDGDDDMDSFNEASQFLTVDEVGEEEEDSSVSADTVTEMKDKTHKTPEQSEDKTDCEPVPAAQTPVTPRRGRPRKRPLDVESSPAPAEVKPKVSTRQSPAPKTQNVSTQQSPAPKTQNVTTQQSPAPKTQESPALKTQEIPAPKTQQTPASKTQQTPAPKTQQTPASKTQQTPAPKTQQTPAPKTQQSPAPKTQESPALKTQEIPAPKTQQTPASKTQQTPAPKTQQTPAPKTQQTPAPKTQQTPAPKTQQTPAPKTQQTPAPKTQQTPAPKTQQTPAPKTQQTPAPKTQQTPAPKTQQTPAPKTQQTPAPKTQQTPAPKTQQTPAPKTQQTPAPKTQQTPAPKTQQTPAPKTQQTPAPKTQQTPAPKTQQTPAPKTQQTPAPKTQQTPAPKTQQTPAPKTQQTPAPKTQQTPAPKTQQTPAPKTQQNVKAVSAETDKASPASYETPSKKKKTEAAEEGAKLAPFNPSTPTETHGQRGAGARLDNRKNQLKANIATKRT
uniref:RRM domain-containing protein n=1 Tax=Leptobrachium leishanense TaxID=445787 RepID=A0A8C5QB81_9ANUR